jgi:hypothetical protein
MKKLIYILIFSFIACLQAQKSPFDINSPVGAIFDIGINLLSNSRTSSSATTITDTSPPSDIDATQLNAIATDTTKIPFSFKVPADNIGVIGFDVKYSNTSFGSNTACNSASGSQSFTNTIASGQTVTLTITGLSSYQNYFFCVRAKDAAGNVSANWAYTTVAALTYPRYVAVGQNCNSWISGDGINWTLNIIDSTTCAGSVLSSIVFGNGLWVAVGGTGGTTCRIYTSADGISWTSRSCPISCQLQSIAFGSNGTNNVYVTTGYINATLTSYPSLNSTDGINWSSSNVSTASFTSVPTSSVVYDSNASAFMTSGWASGFAPVVATANITNPTSWSTCPSLTFTNYNNTTPFAIANGKPGEVAAMGGDSSNSNYYSYWLTTTFCSGAWSGGFGLGSPVTGIQALAYGNSIYLSSPSITCTIGRRTGSLGASFVSSVTVAGCTAPYASIAYSSTDNRFVMVDSATPPKFTYSTTGATATWSTPTASTGANQAKYIAVRP